MLPPSQRFTHLWPAADKAQLVSKQANPLSRDLEAKGWRAWYAFLFGQGFVDILDSAETDDKHHSEAIEWHWESRRALLQGKRPPNDWFAYFPTWARANMKSTVAEAMVVTDAGLSVLYKEPGFALYIGREKGRVQESISNIEQLLSSASVRSLFPSLSQVARNEETNQKRQWTGTFLHTKAGYIVKGGTIESAQAGSRVITEASKPGTRPTFQVPDDIDGRDDSPVQCATNLRALTTEILPMRQANTLTFWAQNLISRYTSRYQIETQRVRVLTNRKPTIRVPAVRDLVTEPRTIDGLIQDIFISGRITWRGWDRARVQDEINTYGLIAFKKECQHEVEQDKEGLVLQHWNDAVHVITKSEFAAKFGGREIPRHWNKYTVNDWARTRSIYHANIKFSLAVSAQNSVLPGCFFVFDARSFVAGAAPEDVAESILSDISLEVKLNDGTMSTWRNLVSSVLQKSGLEQHRMNTLDLIESRRNILANVIPKYVAPILRAQSYVMFRGSHEQNKTGALAVYQRVFGLPFQPTNPGGDGGVDDINLAQRVDYEVPHPIKSDAMGYTRFFLVVEDENAEYRESLAPEELMDSDLFRFQMKNWRVRDPYITAKGEIEGDLLKMHDDFGNGLMMLFYDNCLQATALTRDQKVEAALPQLGRLANELRENKTLSQTDELAYYVLRSQAKRMIGSSGIKRWAEDGEMIRD